MTVASVFRRLPRDRPWLGLGLGAFLFVIAAASRYFLGGLSDGFEPMTFLPAMLLAGLFGGIAIGLAVSLVCIFVAWVWFFPPYGTFILTLHDATTMGVFIVTAGLELCVIRVLNLAINDLALARERSDILFRELQHRVANNLQFAAALLHAGKKTLDDESAGAHAIDASRSRLELMSHVHRRLHDPAAVDLPLDRYLGDLARDLIAASASPHIRLHVGVAHVRLDLDSLMSISLLVAELITNSLKHAFHGRIDGTIAIELSVLEKTCTLTISDDGCGFSAAPAGSKRVSLGQGILQGLAAQVHGSLSFEHGSGTTARLVFPVPHVQWPKSNMMPRAFAGRWKDKSSHMAEKLAIWKHPAGPHDRTAAE